MAKNRDADAAEIKAIEDALTSQYVQFDPNNIPIDALDILHTPAMQAKYGKPVEKFNAPHEMKVGAPIRQRGGGKSGYVGEQEVGALGVDAGVGRKLPSSKLPNNLRLRDESPGRRKQFTPLPPLPSGTNALLPEDLRLAESSSGRREKTGPVAPTRDASLPDDFRLAEESSKRRSKMGQPSPTRDASILHGDLDDLDFHAGCDRVLREGNDGARHVEDRAAKLPTLEVRRERCDLL